jgi:hypothetical protein
MYRRLSVLCLVLVFVLVVGCGETKTKTASVKGTVTLDGQPLKEGEIFFSLEGKPPHILEIKDGVFSGAAAIGKNRVEIRAYKPGAPLSTDPTGTPPKVNYIPAKYNDQSTLDADVPAGGASELKYAVTSN